MYILVCYIVSHNDQWKLRFILMILQFETFLLCTPNVITPFWNLDVVEVCQMFWKTIKIMPSCLFIHMDMDSEQMKFYMYTIWSHFWKF